MDAEVAGASGRSVHGHNGTLELDAGVVWRADDGWRFECPAHCGSAPQAVYATARGAVEALREHWQAEREREARGSRLGA